MIEEHEGIVIQVPPAVATASAPKPQVLLVIPVPAAIATASAPAPRIHIAFAFLQPKVYRAETQQPESASHPHDGYRDQVATGTEIFVLIFVLVVIGRKVLCLIFARPAVSVARL